DVDAPPHDVYAFLLDVNRVAGCVPGAELSEIVDPNTFNGRVKVRVGPITVAYAGTARIVDRDDETHRAELQAEGRETSGPGSARAHAVMTVAEVDGHPRVSIHTDYTVAGRVAQFGRGVMEDVSRRSGGQLADCMKATLEAAHRAPPSSPPDNTSPPGGEVTSEAPPSPPSGEGTSPPAKPINAFGLFF